MGDEKWMIIVTRIIFNASQINEARIIQSTYKNQTHIQCKFFP